MKKIIFSIVCLLAAFTLSACTADNNGTVDNNAGNVTDGAGNAAKDAADGTGD